MTIQDVTTSLRSLLLGSAQDTGFAPGTPVRFTAPSGKSYDGIIAKPFPDEDAVQFFCGEWNVFVQIQFVVSGRTIISTGWQPLNRVEVLS